MLTVLILNDTCALNGGAAKVAIEDARILRQRGHRVIFFSACGNPPSATDGIEWISLGQQDILEDPKRWRAMTRGLWNATAAAALQRTLASLSPDSTIVHLHSWSKALSSSVVVAARRAGFRVVATLHDYFAICPNGGLYDYPTQEVCLRPPMSVSCMTRNCDSRSYWHKGWRVLRQCVWRASGIPQRLDALIAVSGFAAKLLQPHVLGRRIHILPNEMEVSAPVTSPSELRAGFAYAGRASSEKGVDLYLAASQKMEIPAQVWGDGPLLPELRRAWPHAQYSGWLNRQELAERLKDLSVLVVPSRCYETYGLIVDEAAAAGVAVIVAHHGAAAEMIEDGVTGLYFRAGDVEDLSRKMAFLRDHPERSSEMGRLAYERFWARVGRQRHARATRLEDIYRQTIGTPGAATGGA